MNIAGHEGHTIRYEEKGWNDWEIEFNDDGEVILKTLKGFYPDDPTGNLYCETCGSVLEGEVRLA